MATARFYVPADSLGDTLFNTLDTAELLSYSASEIRLGVPGGVTLAILTGQFQFNSDGELLGGTFSGITAYRSDGVNKEFVFNGLGVDIETLVDLVFNGTEEQLGNLFFGGADVFTGSFGADDLPTYGGNDTIDGGAGADTMTGGKGNDTYVVRDAGDRVIETASAAAGGGIDAVQSHLGSSTLPANVENGRIMTSAAARLVGNDLANTLTSGNGNDTLAGGNGKDTLSGSNGNDLLDGGTGNDSMSGGAGNDRYVVGSSGDKVVEALGGGTDSVTSGITHTLATQVEKLTLTGSTAINGTGNPSNNTITGNTANNALWGGEGNDTLTGGNGNDSLDGGTGSDSMSGGAGNDRYVVGSSGDKVVESSAGGTDSVSSSITWTLPAEVESLTLIGNVALNGSGNALPNKLVGNTAANSLGGGIGNDLLDGGGGNDHLIGGTGQDTFRFSSALSGSTNVDRLPDFNVIDDRLNLENAIFTKLASTGSLSSSFFRANTSGAASDGNDHVLYETDTGKLFYDADGSGAATKVLIATLTSLPVLTSADVFVI